MRAVPKIPPRQLPAKLVQLVRAASGVEKSALLALVSVIAAVFAFVELTDAVLEGDALQFDLAVMNALRTGPDLADPIGPRWLETVVRDITALGGTTVLTLLTLTVTGFLLLVRKKLSAIFVIASVIGGVVLSNGFKWLFARARPDLVPHLTDVTWHSFPSGHATMAAVVYLTIGVLLARTYADVRVKLYLLSIAGLVTIAVGLSRVYLGVHWPTDVLAGWAIGAAWALLCWLLMIWMQWRGRIEPEVNGAARRPAPGVGK